MNLLLGAHIHSPRWFVQQQHARSGQQAFRDHDLLLIASAERFDIVVQPGSLDVKIGRHPGRRRRFGGGRKPQTAREPAQAGERYVGQHGEALHQSGDLPVLGRHGEPARNPRGRVHPVQRFRAERDSPAHFRVQAHEALQQFRAARPHQTVDADYFARVQTQPHVAQQRSSAFGGQRKRLDAHQFRTAFERPRRFGGARGPAGHLLHDPARIHIGGRGLRDQAAIAQHSNVIGNRQQLLQAVRNVNDRHAVRSQVADDAEEYGDLRRAQGGGRLVHHQDADIAGQRLGDFDNLLLAQRQLPDQRARVDRVLQPRQQLAGPIFLLPFVEHAVDGQFARQIDVLRHAEVRAEVQFLVDHADPVSIRVPYGAQ